MFGAIYGDVIGSYYETHCTKNYNFTFESESTFTDDSVLAAAVCRTILDNPQPAVKFKLGVRADEYAAHYRRFYSYYPNAGFGDMFADWAKNPSKRRQRSYGNGAAMRVIPIGYAYDTLEQTLIEARASCIPTHNCREAIKGALAVVSAVYLARGGESKYSIKEHIEKKYGYNLSMPLSDLREIHVFNSRASYSVPAAITAFFWSDDYESAVRYAVALGGDADTEACIAGGIAEAFYHKIPDDIRRFCDLRIDGTIKNTVREFFDRYII